MKLIDTILLSLSVAFFVIGLAELFKHGIAESYFIFMLSFIFIAVLQYIKRNRKIEDKKNEKAGKKPAKKNKKR